MTIRVCIRAHPDAAGMKPACCGRTGHRMSADAHHPDSKTFLPDEAPCPDCLRAMKRTDLAEIVERRHPEMAS